jgi:alcohol dehydrogenase class IV
LVAVPTTAGSGSETSRFFILGENGAKRARRSWSCVPDLTVLDPRWLSQMPARGIVLGAFDAYCHLWETFVCRNERSPHTDMLALTGVPKIAAAMTALTAGDKLDARQILDLHVSSALGGQAISNVRTGLIHTLAESLSPLTQLSHPETLWVFYAKARASYAAHVADRIAEMDRALGGPGGLRRLDRIWEKAFGMYGIDADIQTTLGNIRPNVDDLMANVVRDTVLLKENPAPVDWNALRVLASEALGAGRVAA